MKLIPVLVTHENCVSDFKELIQLRFEIFLSFSMIIFYETFEPLLLRSYTCSNDQN